MKTFRLLHAAYSPDPSPGPAGPFFPASPLSASSLLVVHRPREFGPRRRQDQNEKRRRGQFGGKLSPRHLSAPLLRSLATLAAFALAILLSPALAYNNFSREYNHPELKWYTLETPHLRVHYFEGLRHKAREIARISEPLCKAYRDHYNIVFPGKTDLVVWDSDQAGGWAAPVLNLVSIDVHDFDYRLRGTTRWLENVVAHEIAHLFSIRSGLKFPPWIPDIRLGYFDYPNEQFQSHGFSVMSTDIMPQWFVEGVAQFEASREGSDLWDTHRDMILRVSALEDKLLTYDQMGVFSGVGSNFEKAYNQGFSMVSYIEEKYGYNAVVSLLRESAVFHHQSFGPVVKRVLGITANDLYAAWKKEIRGTYARQIKAIGPQVYGKKLTRKGYSTAHPRWSRDGNSLYFLTNWEADYGFRSLRKYSFSDTIKEDDQRFSMVLPGISSGYSLTADEKRILYISSKKRDKYKWPRSDVFLKEIKPKKKWFWPFGKFENQLTHGLSVLYADLSSDARFVAVSKKHKATDWLGILDLKDSVPRYIFPSRSIEDTGSTHTCNIYTPRISPDGSRIVFSYFDGTHRQIGLIDTAGTTYYTLFKSGFDDRDPSWSPDGKWVVFTSDRTGIFNLYKKNVESGHVVRITNVAGGAFYPEFSPDGRRIAYINYDSDGLSLYVCADTVLEKLGEAPIIVESSPDSLPPLKLQTSPKKYRSRPHNVLVSPILLGQEILSTDVAAGQGQQRWFAGAIANAFDPLNKHYLAGLCLFQVGNGINYLGPDYPNFVNPDKDKEFSLFYENRTMTPTLAGEFLFRSIHDLDRFWHEDLRDTVQLNYQISLMNFGLSGRYQLAPNHKLHILGDHFRSSAYLYDTEYFPRYDYLRGYRAGGMWTHLSRAPNAASNIAPQGMYAKLKLDHWRNQLIKEGTFFDAFVITDNGVLEPNLQPHNFNMGKFNFKIGLPNPLYAKHTVGLSLSTVALDRRVHSFFEVGPFLKGYPFLLNRDSLYVAGNKAFQAEVDYYVPIAKNIDRSLGFLFFDQLYTVVFAEAGAAWNKSLEEMKDIKQDDFLKSAGAELRLECLSYNVYPFSVYFRSAYGFDHPDKKQRLRHQFGIMFSFEDWDLIDIPDYISRNTRRWR